MRLEFEFFGDVEIARHFDRAIDAASDCAPAFQEMADDLANLEERRFASEGPGWAALSPAYAARKRPAGPILTRTGRLRRSLTSRPFGVEDIGRHEATFGSGVDYGKYHQKGTTRMPQRTVVRLTASDRRRWVKYAQKHLFGDGR